MSIKTIMLSVGTTISTVFLYLFGSLDAMLLALFFFVLADFITGMMKAVVFKELNSEKFYKGGIKKIGILIIIAVANVLDNAMDLNGILRSVTIGYYVANEGISIVENWAVLGLPIPIQIKKILEQIKDTTPKE